MTSKALPRIIRGLREIVPAYDGLIIDLWGVLHDGYTPYPGVVDALAALVAAKKKTIMLSNAPRRSETLVDLMTRLGIGRELYGAIVTSGEAVHVELARRSDPWFAALGRRCFHMGTMFDRDLFGGLDIVLVDNLADADFVLVTGPDAYEDRIEDFAPTLQAARARDLPLVCANPDLVVMSEGRSLLCAGSLALYYQEIGGDVRYRGKPDPAIYEVCFAMLGMPRHRVLAVGDSFRTDVAGATAAGIDCLLCTGGIHADELGVTYGVAPTPERLAEVISIHDGLTPIAAIGGFAW